MAQGTVTLFHKGILALNNAVHDFDTDVYKIAWVNNDVVPVASQAAPTLATYIAGEQTGGTFPITGGDTIVITAVESAGTTTIAPQTNPSYVKNAGNPTAVFWGILYNSSKADQAIAFVEMDISGADGTLGLISLTWGANLYTMTQG